jgi:hypothetical protein
VRRGSLQFATSFGQAIDSWRNVRTNDDAVIARLQVLVGVIFGVLLAGALLMGALPHRAAASATRAAARAGKVTWPAKSSHATHDLRKVKTGWSALKANLRHDERSSRTMMCDDADDDDDDDSPDLSTVPRSDDGDDVRAAACAETVAPCEPRDLPTIVSRSDTLIQPAPGHGSATERPPRA